MNVNPYVTPSSGTREVMPRGPQPTESRVKTPAGALENCFEESISPTGNYDEEWMSFVERHSTESCWASRDRAEADVLPRVWNMPRF
jgi:hypothetical protein